jgi:hypothetical protein
MWFVFHHGPYAVDFSWKNRIKLMALGAAALNVLVVFVHRILPQGMAWCVRLGTF